MKLRRDDRETFSKPFSVKRHKETFVDYLEVLILEDGTVVYAIPSHQLKALELITTKTGETIEEISARCPPEYCCDFNVWLARETGAVMVWNNFYEGELNDRQIKVLVNLAEEGLYYGSIDVDFVETSYRKTQSID